jgi:peptide-methionine (R)-S-oxide reductase
VPSRVYWQEGKLTPQSYMVCPNTPVASLAFTNGTRGRLTGAQLPCVQVLRRKATEPGHQVRVANGGFDDLEEEGVYVCAGCSQPLFTSQMKFDCGCGWPGFWGVIPDAIYEERDADGFRVEILCNGCNGHVGHVFRGEGFRNAGDTENYDERHCANSCSLAFVPAGSTEQRRCTYNGQVFGH